MSGIFISYRRASSAACAYRLVDELKERFGDEAIFFDVESIDPGVAFAQVIQNALSKCSIALIVIGPQWLHVQDDDGKRRLDNADDWVRHEVNAALNSRARVIPLLVEGAAVPAPDELPDNIRELAHLQAFTINKSPEYWDFDVKRLEERLRKIDRQLPDQHQRKPGSHPPVSSGGFSKKVIWGYGVAGLFALSLTSLASDDDPINTSYGLAFFFGVAFVLHVLGLSDINKGLSKGRTAAIGGMVASIVLGVVALAIGALLGGQINDSAFPEADPQPFVDERNPPIPPGNVVADAGNVARTPDLTGAWSSNIGSFYQFGRNPDGIVYFSEFNAGQVQVGYGEGSYADNLFAFEYRNSLLGTSGHVEMALDASSGNLLRGTYYDDLSGQSMNFELYRMAAATR